MKVEVIREDRTMAVLDLRAEELPRPGDYMSVSDPVDSDQKYLSGFGTRVENVSWHYKGTRLSYVIVKVV
jgi:hypothetical protein